MGGFLDRDVYSFDLSAMLWHTRETFGLDTISHKYIHASAYLLDVYVGSRDASVLGWQRIALRRSL